MQLKEQHKTDLLEVCIIVFILLLIIVIYVPVAIWEEENYYQKESRFRMNNLYDIETFHKSITGNFNPNFLEAMNLVNAARDSVVADSLFIEEQLIKINGKEYIVDIYEDFSFEYDTTFGFKTFRRDTVLDTTLQIAIYDDALDRSDSIFIRKRELLSFQNDPNFNGVVKVEPVKRIELVEYYKTFLPDSSTYYCPLTKDSYKVNISDDGSSLRVSSPINEVVKKPRYFLFSFKANNHGVIKDGIRSWD
ncbi:MAG: hypothetical protein CMG74_03685 [Candidatus Marinimicrobia bacterium]|nr:hypothetical protein [Candidatus Neomarinimicrobiota bacterium]|tara:strand:- start:2720 stop:3466 length:747 start_codon:yes stop_codon:yes gene_type:complete